MKLSLSRDQRLRKSFEFRKVRSKGLLVRTKPLWLQFCKSNGEVSRLGVIASKRLGNAVARNRAKRISRELFRMNNCKFPFALDLVVLPRSSMLTTPFNLLQKTFLDALSKASSQP